MLPLIISAIIACVLALIGAYVGLRLARAIGDQFDELMPQRMVDYSGFIETTCAPE
jgi:urea transporter